MKNKSYRHSIKHTLRSLFAREGLWAAILMLFLSACDSINCPLNSKVAAIYSFYDSNGKAFTIGDTLTVTAVGTNQVLVNKLVNQSKISLPVSYYAPCDTLVLRISDTDGLSATDTIWMEKVSTPHADDPSCPIHIWHKVTDIRYTDNIIDTIAIVNPDINYNGWENFHIHFITE